MQWEQVDCIHRNGDIIGYSVLYGIQGSGYSKNLSVSRGETTEAIISNLDSATKYAIQVAAMNSAGIGAHSIAIYAITRGKIFK